MTTMIFKWTRALSREGFTTTNFYFSDMHKSTYYVKRIARPHYIAIISNYSDINEFSLATSTFDMSYGAWLVIFIYNGYGSDYCHNPPGNIFHLKYNTEMLVRCGKENILREWYSINSNRTEIIDIAKWNLKDGITDKISNSHYGEIKSNLQGLTIKAVVVKDNKFVTINKDGQLDGVVGKIMRELCSSLNFTFDIVSEVPNNGIWNPKFNNCSGAIDELCSKRADIAFSDFTMTSLRLNVIDFTIPLLVSKNCLFIKKPKRFFIKWSSYFLTFSLTLWIAVFGIIIVTTILLVFIKKQNGTDRCFVNLLSDNFLEIWGIICQQGLADFPDNSSLRIVYFSLFILAVVLLAAYSAALISFLTSNMQIVPFRTLEDFIDDGTYQLAVYYASSDYELFATSKDPMIQELKKLMIDENKLPETTIEAFRMVCTNKKLAMYTSIVRKEAVNSQIPCSVVAIPTGRIENLAIVLSKHNPFTDIINFNLQKFINNGMMYRLKDKIFNKNFNFVSQPQPVRINSILLLIMFIIIGVVLGVLILILEKCIFAYNSKKSLMVDHHISLIKSSGFYLQKKNNVQFSRYYFNRKIAPVRY
ncbi:PREDICTED: glutamate receptor ionotropic, delta-1-like [Polistes dominula]|uniref:Glutamate receptor ionotropic, delta-1-like n=1 Tax=Polistes dominula TaxID=743375 RepID=A0ABM1JET5_POLDO|nr:PREDICTED: glutamate receptor ionotropic, delta-1-like [Polistes dominula]